MLLYLTATLKGAVYYPSAHSLTWKKAGHNIAFHAFEIGTSNVADRTAAEREIEGLIDLVNRTGERRAEITPSTQTHQRPTPMAVYKLLPGTNCKACEEATCWVFAAKLAISQKKLSDCPLLHEPQYVDKLAALEEIVIEAPAIV